MDIFKMTALSLGKKLRKKEIKSVDVVKALLTKIEQTKELNSYITVNGEQALEAAAKIDKKITDGEILSPLMGVPILIKDNICTKGVKTTCGSKMLENFVPPYNATVIDRLEKNGVILLGKSNMDEFAMGSSGQTSYFGSTKNPYDKTRVPGGSSSGSAASVAAGSAVMALGTDTGGSIRQPAAFCGVTGFKPSYGRVSRFGLIAHASSLDQIGPIARSVEDCAAISDILCGIDPKDSTTVDTTDVFLKSLSGDVRGLRIGLATDCLEDGVDTEVAQKVRTSAVVLESIGAIVSEITLPFTKLCVPCYSCLASAEASSNLSRFDGVKYTHRTNNFSNLNELYARSRTEGFGDEVKKRILLGTFVLSQGNYEKYYIKALKIKTYISAQFNKLFKDFDLILCPTTTTTAYKLKTDPLSETKPDMSDIFTISANLAGLPALSVPCGFDKQGLPMGLQLIGRPLDDKTVLNVGFAYQQSTRHHKPEVK